ncbi:glycoside hydrolase family 88 protein [Simiduia sp. 21SJ11W-1]|uniref:glycoside hydrolase family 88/105 protein n=1 Tax=Simiduia sp. 21SJ11W-1 TaxID=2909669 RepID=UPI00209FAF81|nr:glycoside hydrolase family 88 protein [Simiduia sp. 21SJ11W-1]UTA48652.1 glycoside hydrolase family 88 protein [Simiduia sp. 21SJ11W-1]
MTMHSKAAIGCLLTGLLVGLGGCGGSDSAPVAKAAPEQAVSAKANRALAVNPLWPVVVPYQKPGTEAADFNDALTKGAITQVANQVADWQLAQYDLRSNKMRAEGRPSGIPQGWMYATWQIGLLAWADASEQVAYEQAVINASAVNQWLLGPRIYHADDHAMGAVYLSLYERRAAPERVAHVKQTLDQVLAAPLSIDLTFNDDDKVTHTLAKRDFIDPACTDRWCWADAIFMAPPVWAQYARISGDNRYLEFMDREFWATTDFLYRADEKLYLRDSRYFERKDSKGRLIYWGRGNGWVLAGIARVLKELPEDFAGREKYLKLYREMSERLVDLQQADGSWPSSLLEIEQQSPPESSGTGLLVYGLAWGVNQGLLKDEKYQQAVTKGWQSLVASVHGDGKLGWVQQVAFAPGSATENDTQLYGTGALLLAASEVIKQAE